MRSDTAPQVELRMAGTFGVIRDGTELPAAAEQNVASLVSRLRGVLGSGVIQGGRPGYRLAAAPQVSVDLDTAARYCDQAERNLAGRRARRG